jgi:hypothetical protein
MQEFDGDDDTLTPYTLAATTVNMSENKRGRETRKNKKSHSQKLTNSVGCEAGYNHRRRSGGGGAAAGGGGGFI